MRTKRLDLKEWMKYEKFLSSGIYKQVSPVFNRNGWYMVAGFSWFEFNGKAYEYCANQFKIELSYLNASELTDDEIIGLSAICETKLATHKQRDIYSSYLIFKECRKNERTHIKLENRIRRRRGNQ